MSEVGRVLGTDPAHPLDFWVGVGDDQYLQLDDIVAVRSEVPGRGDIWLYGVVDIVRAKYEGAKFDSDVFRVASGVLPVGIATAAHVSVTRIEPEIFVPPQPGQQAFRADEAQREQALYFDRMEHKFAAGLSREGDVLWGNLDFLDGTRGAHVNISGISGVATKTSCAMFLLYSLFHSDALGMNRANARAVIFNVKGEDLMFADKANGRIGEQDEEKYRQLGLPAGPFQDVGLWSPAQKGGFEIVHSLGARSEGVTAYVWSLREFCQGRLLRFLFAEADSETSQLSYAVTVVERYLADQTRGQPESQTWVELEGMRITTFEDLVAHIDANRDLVFAKGSLAMATQDAFLRRLNAVADSVGHLIRKLDSADDEKAHRIDWAGKQLNVIDIHNLHDRAKRFVVGVVLTRSAGCIINDYADRERDRSHPGKRHRPLASGRVTPARALALSALLAVLGGALAWAAGPIVLLIVAGYAAMNIAYTFALKHVVILDVFLIATGFLLRILAGTAGIGIPPSQWLLVCGLFLTLFLGFTKRRSELLVVSGDYVTHRKALLQYSPALLDKVISVCAAAVLLSYSLYAMAPETFLVHATDSLIYTIPFVAYGIFRYLYLLHAKQAGADTSRDLARDPHLAATVLAWGAATALLIL